MIFVTVGNHYQCFERLIRKMDEIAGKIDEKVIMQIGHTNYKPINAEYFDFKTYPEIQELNQKARVVVCHGGEGSIITALEQGTPVISVPRLEKYGEHSNDHQLDIVKAMAEEGKIMAVCDVDELEDALKEVDKIKINVKRDKRLVNALKGYIQGLEK
jgi:UDP-N-acetylglucosamine transferase subunit ALG13